MTKQKFDTFRLRLSIDVDQVTKEKVTRLLPWGTQRLVLIEVIKLGLIFIESKGIGIAMDAFLNGKAKIVLNSEGESAEEHY